MTEITVKQDEGAAEKHLFFESLKSAEVSDKGEEKQLAEAGSDAT